MISAGCVLFVMGLNLLTVRLFGEIEFWFALIKILAIIGLIGVGGYMIFSHFKLRKALLPALVMSGHMAVYSRKVQKASWQDSRLPFCVCRG